MCLFIYFLNNDFDGVFVHIDKPTQCLSRLFAKDTSTRFEQVAFDIIIRRKKIWLIITDTPR